MQLIPLFFISILFFSEAVYSHSDEEKGASSEKYAEYSWNPSNVNTSPRLMQFYELNQQIDQHYDDQNFAPLSKLIEEYLSLAEIYRNNWNYGNAIHDGNRILGLVSYNEGNIDAAVSYLIMAGESTGSPQLDTFGPNLDLADLLMRKGKIDAVVVYLRGVQKFWRMDEGIVDRWITAIEQGKRPKLDRFASF